MEEQVKEELDKIVADILRDVSGVDALRYYTDKILDTIEAERQEDRREGRREVVEWIKQNAGLGAKTIEELNTGYSFIPIRSDKWQAILKEWFGETANL